MASCEPITVTELQTLLSLEERNQRRWSELGSTFWLKLLISKRSDILTKCTQYQSPTLDSVYIDLLKMLVGKSYGKIHKYFSDISLLLKFDISFHNLSYFLKSKSVKEGKCLSEILKGLFGTRYVELSPWWLTKCFKLHRKMCKVLSAILAPEQHLEVEFPFPCFWSHCEAPWPFEVFVRSRWGDSLLKSLACKREDILWWTVNKKCEFSPPQECTLNSDMCKMDSSPVPVKFCSWLAPYCHTFIQGSYERENVAMQCFGEDKALWWDVLELSFPPMWSKKFYSGPAAVTDNFTNSSGLDCCVWISMWLNSCSLEFLAVLQESQQEFLAHGPDHVEDGLSWRDRMLEYKKTLESMQSMPDCPAPETTASFLLEPALLVQLPWNHSLLQLWLAAALVEVTRCEIASMELRHWPIPEPLIIQVTEVLSVLSVCKNTLLCGLSMLSRDIFHFPNITCGYPGAVMDAVILPVLPLLRFVVDHGIQCLTELKRAAWCRDKGVPTKCVPVSAYTLRPEESEFFHHHFFHIRYWMDDKAQLPYSDMRSLKSQFEETTSAPLDNECKDFYLKQLSTEESVCEASLQNFTPKGDPRELVTRICQDVLSEAPTPEGVKSAERHALLAIKVAEFASGLETEETPSLLRCLVRLTGEALVREQEVRVAVICAQASGHPMTLHDLPPDYDLQLVTDSWAFEFNKLYDFQKKAFKKIDRNALLSKILPNPQILSDPLLTPEEIMKNKIAESTNTNFDQNCKIIMLRCFCSRYDAFEDMKEQTLPLDPYAFYYIPASILINATSRQTPSPATSLLLSNYVDQMLDTFYKLTIFDQGLLVNMKRDPVSMDRETSYNTSTTSEVVSLPYDIVRELTEYLALASMCMDDSDSLFEHIKGIFLQYFHNKIPRHKLEAHRQNIWVIFLNKIYSVQKMDFEEPFSTLNEEVSSKTRKLRDLCAVRRKVDKFSHTVILFCESQELTERVHYKLLASMQPQLMEYSLLLLRAAIWQSFIPKDSRIEYGKEYKLSKELKNQIYNFFVNICVVILNFKEKTDVMEISKRAKFPILRYRATELVFKPGFEEKIIQGLKFKMPCLEKSERIINSLAKQFLQMTLESTTTSEGARVAVAPTATSTTPEVCHACSKTSLPGTNFIRFEGKFYCSSECKGSVQKQWCRLCKKKEQPGQRFLLCAECEKDGSYPYPNYFCSEQCRDTWWTEEHLAEHLEFELGLGRWYEKPAP